MKAAQNPSKTRVRTLFQPTALALAALFLTIVVLQPWLDPRLLFMDPITAAQVADYCCHAYYGSMSTLGVMLWAATAAVCFFAAIAYHLGSQPRETVRFAGAAGLLSGWLALDDALLLHEIVLPKIGLPELLIVAIYVVLVGLYVATSWRVVLRNDFWLLIIGGVAFSLSLGIDSVLRSIDPLVVTMEDAFKFFGIVCWALFHIVAALSELHLQRRA